MTDEERMMKLSRYQLKIVDALKAGEKLYYLSGIHGHFWIGDVHPCPSFATVDKLKRAGVLKCIKDDWRGSVWVWNEVQP